MNSIVHHVGLKATDFVRSRDFYTAALGTLGIRLIAELEAGGQRHAGYGIERGTFWIGDGKVTLGDAHVAFEARSRSEVESFYTVALSMGGRDNGPPGLRRHYTPDYYAAFVLDPDGNNIEAVFAEPERENDERV
jgi:catechol 2,3-dioxygenase-like lactoylglutathione lyase family enzyme